MERIYFDFDSKLFIFYRHDKFVLLIPFDFYIYKYDMFYVSLHNRKIIKKMIGEEVNYFYLKRWTMRVRRLFLKKNKPQKSFCSKQNQKYKLVISHKEGNQQIKKIIKNYKFVEHLNYTPKILWSNENFFISEYLEGEFANFKNVNFEIQLAKLLADIHKINNSM